MRYACQPFFTADAGFVSPEVANDLGKEGIDREFGWMGWYGVRHRGGLEIKERDD